MYIFIREDLPHAYQIVQAAHATHQAGIRFGEVEAPPHEPYHTLQTHFVLIGAKDEKALQEIAMHLDFHQIEHEMFYEPDHDTGYTAIATKPLCGDERKALRKFNTYKGEENGHGNNG